MKHRWYHRRIGIRNEKGPRGYTLYLYTNGFFVGFVTGPTNYFDKKYHIGWVACLDSGSKFFPRRRDAKRYLEAISSLATFEPLSSKENK